MVAVKLILLVLIISLCASSSTTPFVSCGNNASNEIQYSDFLEVPPSEFAGSLRDTIGVVQQLASNLSRVANSLSHFCLSNAVSDCLDLLHFSADELDWSLAALQNQKGKYNNNTGNLSSDLRTWLSAALVNQDTCSEGLDSCTKSIVIKKLVSIGLSRITSLVQDLLAKVHPDPVSDHYDHNPNGQIPSWVRNEDRNLLLQPHVVAVDAVVAQDGTGNFTSVQEAVLAAPNRSPRRHVIYIKRGVYKEYVEVKKKKWNLMIIGDGMDATIISGNHSRGENWTTFHSATFAVNGLGFIARDITFENTAGPLMHQAVALRSDSDLSVFYRCGFRGYQDTLYTHSMRQFFRECVISGTVDFIFGDATVVFQKCEIRARQGHPKQKNTITAHGRENPYEPTGFSFQFCNITADLGPWAAPINSTYLGRPWKPYSRTVIMQSFLSNVIRPEGWLEWNGTYALDSLLYAEYMNYGPRAGLGSRVNWPGYHVFNESSQAQNYTVAQFIEGSRWLPSTGVHYTPGFGV